MRDDLERNEPKMKVTRELIEQGMDLLRADFRKDPAKVMRELHDGAGLPPVPEGYFEGIAEAMDQVERSKPRHAELYNLHDKKKKSDNQ
jgi:hypothetical protein